MKIRLPKYPRLLQPSVMPQEHLKDQRLPSLVWQAGFLTQPTMKSFGICFMLVWMFTKRYDIPVEFKPRLLTFLFKIPKDRFNVDTHYDPTGKIRNTSHTPYGCFIDEPGLFDPRFFNMSPREATQTDPMHRLGLASAYEALEMAGYVPNRSPSTRLERIGTFYGQTSDDWREINEAQDIDTYFITAGVRAFAPVSKSLIACPTNSLTKTREE